MMKLICVLLFVSSVLASGAQNITATKPARLQVYFSGPDEQQYTLSSEELSIHYDNLKMTGELALSSITTDAGILHDLLRSAEFEKITFSGIIPEGRFVFQNTTESRFTVETDLVYGDRESRVLLEFLVSNLKSSSANTFEITCTGSVSLASDLGLAPVSGLDDKASFQFFQNVSARSY
jgi:hypothetical protein